MPSGRDAVAEAAVAEATLARIEFVCILRDRVDVASHLPNSDVHSS